MRAHTTQPRGATGVILLVLIAGGCGSDPAPAEPEPQPHYQQIPKDLCDRLRVEEVAERFDLSMAPYYERSSDYETEPTRSYELCTFWGWAEDGRFATGSDDFEPSGTISIEVYRELTDAQEAYRQDARGEFEFRADHEPRATATELAGWWDSGMSLEWVRFRDDDSEISHVVVAQLIRHENLVVSGNLQEQIPTKDTAEVFALLHDLERALIDEVAEHLTLTTE